MKIKKVLFGLMVIMLTGCAGEIKMKNNERDFKNIRGFDASAESDSWNKGKYLDDDGIRKDIFEILKNHGVNWIRLRIWNDPSNENNPEFPGASDLETVVAQAVRVKSFGLKLLLDFHYSDYWADPGKQAMPHAWLECKSPDEVSEKLYEWTSLVLKTLKAVDAEPDMIQIGNEINTGIMTGWYDKGKLKPLSSAIGGSSTTAQNNYLKYLQSGITAARTVCPESKIMLHVAEGGGSIDWLLEMYKEAGLTYDVIGLSYYPFEKSHGTLESLTANIKSFKKKYKKSVVIAETAHPWMTDKPLGLDLVNATKNLTGKDGKLYKGIEEKKGRVLASKENQTNVIKAVADVSSKAGADGFFTWGGEYIGSWKYGMFDDKGHPQPVLSVFSEK